MDTTDGTTKVVMHSADMAVKSTMTAMGERSRPYHNSQHHSTARAEDIADRTGGRF